MCKNVKIGLLFETKSFGTAKVISVKGWDNVKVKFLLTGFELITRKERVVSGSIRDPLYPSVYGVGFIGVGEYNSSSGKSGIHNTIYKTWSSMLKRCYSGKYKTYYDCSVCDEWKNFQNFARWYEDNYPSDGMKYDLDKDIKIDGNKIYSPDTCIFASPFDNKSKAMSKECRMINPEGELVLVCNVRKFCKDNDLNQSNFNMVSLGQRESSQGWTKAD